MKATFSSIIMDSIKFWTFTTSQCLSARQYFPVLNKREQWEYHSKFKPLLALSVRILMAPTLPWLLFIASSCFMWQYLVFMSCFSHINLSVSQSRAGHYAHFREQKKKTKWGDLIVATEQHCWEQALIFLNPIPGVHHISSGKLYPFTDRLIWGVDQRFAPNWDEGSGHLPVGFLGHCQLFSERVKHSEVVTARENIQPRR